MADILEAMLAQLSWPQDADHIVNIKSTLDTIKSSLFTSLLDVQTQVSDTIEHDKIVTIFNQAGSQGPWSVGIKAAPPSLLKGAVI